MAIAKVMVPLPGVTSHSGLSLEAWSFPGTQNNASTFSIDPLTVDSENPDEYWGTVNMASVAEGRYKARIVNTDGVTMGYGYLYMTNTTNVHPLVDDPSLANASATIVGTALQGTGADQVTVSITVGGNPLTDADVWITSDAAGTTVVAGTLQTDSDGECLFLLDAGTTYYLWAQKDGVNSIQGQAFVAVAD